MYIDKESVRRRQYIYIYRKVICKGKAVYIGKESLREGSIHR